MKLPKSVTKTMYVIYNTARYYSGDERIGLLEYDPSDLDMTTRVLLGSVEVTFDVPQHVDVVGTQVANLRRRRDDLVANMTAEAAQIDRQIQELLALPAPGAEVVA